MQLKALMPSVNGQIATIEHVLVVDASLKNPEKKAGFFGKLFGTDTKSMPGIEFPVFVASPAEQLPPGWFHMPPDEHSLIYQGPGGVLSRDSPNLIPDRSSLGRNLVVIVHKARDLVSLDRNGFSDPFVNCWVLTTDMQNPGQVIANGNHCRRTKKFKKALNPDFWEVGRNVFNFYMPAGTSPSQLCLECRDWERIGSDRFMGFAVLDLAPLLATPPVAMVTAGGATPTMVLHGWVPLGPRPDKKKDKSGRAIFVSVGMLG
jgi:hypothetical protein